MYNDIIYAAFYSIEVKKCYLKLWVMSKIAFSTRTLSSYAIFTPSPRSDTLSNPLNINIKSIDVNLSLITLLYSKDIVIHNFFFPDLQLQTLPNSICGF